MAKTSAPIDNASTDLKPDLKIEHVRGGNDVPTFYVNNTFVETSVWDIRLRLGETLETDREHNILRVREIANVRMSPQHARAVLTILENHLENYEKQFGKIPAVPQQERTRSDK